MLGGIGALGQPSSHAHPRGQDPCSHTRAHAGFVGSRSRCCEQRLGVAESAARTSAARDPWYDDINQCFSIGLWQAPDARSCGGILGNKLQQCSQQVPPAPSVPELAACPPKLQAHCRLPAAPSQGTGVPPLLQAEEELSSLPLGVGPAFSPPKGFPALLPAWGTDLKRIQWLNTALSPSPLRCCFREPDLESPAVTAGVWPGRGAAAAPRAQQTPLGVQAKGRQLGPVPAT